MKWCKHCCFIGAQVRIAFGCRTQRTTHYLRLPAQPCYITNCLETSMSAMCLQSHLLRMVGAVASPLHNTAENNECKHAFQTKTDERMGCSVLLLYRQARYNILGELQFKLRDE